MRLASIFRHIFPCNTPVLCRQLLGCLLLAGLSQVALAADSDGDGVDDSVDAFPTDAAAAVDTDGDGQPDELIAVLVDSFESGDFSRANWTRTSSPSGVNWRVVPSATASHGNYFASVTKPKGAYISQTLTLTITVNAPAKLVYDYIFTGYNGVVQSFFYGPYDSLGSNGQGRSSNWRTVSQTLAVGAHYLQWIHDCSRDPAICAINGDIVKIDRVRLEYISSTGLTGDTDDDNDGVADIADPFPRDTDNDGTDNNADLDDDNDGMPDYIDAAPLNAANASERNLLLNAPFSGSGVMEGKAGQ